MKRCIHLLGIAVLLLMCAGVAAAQGNNRIDGQVLDTEAKPWPDVTVTLKNEESGQTVTVKTDKNGKFVQLGLRAGIYDVSVTSASAQVPPFTQKLQVKEGQSGTLVINYKEIMANFNASAEGKKRAEEENAFKSMKTHFDAGRQAMTEADAVGQQLKTATPDQKSSLQEKRTTDCQTAANEFAEAAKGVQSKDAKNTAVVLQNLGAANECAGKYDDAVAAFQKSIDAQPNAGTYTRLSTNLANAAVEQTDPNVIQQKVNDASAACDKAAALDASNAVVCWKNLGIVLYNKQHQKEAVAAFQKATQADPKDAQTWFLLGSSLTAMIDTKMEGNKMIAVIPPGTQEAYQKCIDVAPNGPYAAQAKQGLDELAQLSGGESTTVTKGKTKPH